MDGPQFNNALAWSATAVLFLVAIAAMTRGK